MERQQQYQILHSNSQELAELHGYTGETGNVPVKMRFPDGSTTCGRFWVGSPRSALVWLAVNSDWAQRVHPTGISFATGFPPAPFSTEGEITADLTNVIVIVKETPFESPANVAVGAEEVAVPSSANSVASDPQAPPPVPQREVFETPPASPLRPPVSGNPGMQNQSSMITEVVEITGVSRESATASLQEASWDVAVATNRILDAQTGAQELRALARNRQRPSTRNNRMTSSPVQPPWASQGRPLASSGTTGSNSGGRWIRDCGLGVAAGCVSSCVVAICISML